MRDHLKLQLLGRNTRPFANPVLARRDPYDPPPTDPPNYTQTNAPRTALRSAPGSLGPSVYRCIGEKKSVPSLRIAEATARRRSSKQQKQQKQRAPSTSTRPGLLPGCFWLQSSTDPNTYGGEKMGGPAVGTGGASGNGKGKKARVIPAGQGGVAIRVLATAWGLAAMLTAFIVAFSLQVRCVWLGWGGRCNGLVVSLGDGWIGGWLSSRCRPN